MPGIADLAALRQFAEKVIQAHAEPKMLACPCGCIPCEDAAQAAQAILALVARVEAAEADSAFEREQAGRANARVKGWTNFVVMRGLPLQPHVLQDGVAAELPAPESVTTLIEESDRLRAERDALARERDEAGRLVKFWEKTATLRSAVARANGDEAAAWYERAQVAESRLAALRAGLKEYGHHPDTCELNRRIGVGQFLRCTCGLDALLREEEAQA